MYWYLMVSTCKGSIKFSVFGFSAFSFWPFDVAFDSINASNDKKIVIFAPVK